MHSRSDGRLWLEVVDQLSQMCKSIVSSHDFQVAVLKSQESLSSKMRLFTISLGDRMQNLSINMKSQTAGLAQRVEALAETVSSLKSTLPVDKSPPHLESKAKVRAERGGPVGAPCRQGPWTG